VSAQSAPGVVLRLPPLDGATAAWILDLCGQRHTALWRAYGDEIEAHWTATEPVHPIYGGLPSSAPKKRWRRRRRRRRRLPARQSRLRRPWPVSLGR
jgi:hypothetical protein